MSNKVNIFDILVENEIQFVVGGSFPLYVMGLRELGDLDIQIASKDAWERISKMSGSIIDGRIIRRNDTIFNKEYRIEIFCDFPRFEEIAKKLDVDGTYQGLYDRSSTWWFEMYNVHVWSVQDMIMYKLIRGREKDLADLELIKKSV